MIILTGILALIALAIVLVATFFSVVGVIGYLRLPDVYTRLHATGMVGTFGVVLLLASTPFLIGVSAAKATILIAFLLISGPVVSHAIGSAAFRIGIDTRLKERDDLNADVSKPHK